MAKDPDKIYGIAGQEKAIEVQALKKKNAGRTKKPAVRQKVPALRLPELKNVGKKKAFPKDIIPMLATLVDQPFDSDDWIYEVKWDGYRTLAYLSNSKVQLRSRNNKSFDEKFYPVAETLKTLGLTAVFDGEVIVVNEEGRSDFGRLQNWRSEADGELRYYVFDLLWLDGYSLVHLNLEERRSLLASILPANETILLSQSFDASGTEFYEAARKMNLEGIMAKKKDSVYLPDTRSKEWLKIKVNQRQEMVIGGYTRNEGTSKAFSALLVGVYRGTKLHYTGKIGTGFPDKLQTEMMAQFSKLKRKTNPFDEEPDINKPSRFRPNPPHADVTWLKPELVCEVSYTEMTSDGVMRHPSFEGMRTDKKASLVKEEVAMAVKKATGAKKQSKVKTTAQKKATSKTVVKTAKRKSGGAGSLLTKAGTAQRKSLLNPSDASQERTVNGEKLKFTNLDKI